MQAILASWRRQSPAIRVLRAFLGLTFLYAGWHKVSDPKFIPSGFAESVGAFAKTSPISQLLDIAARSPEAFGWGIILAELAVGIFTLLGVASVAAALGGLGLSLTLWLSSSWNVRPYFLAADPAYVALWAVYATALWDMRARRRQPLDRRGFLRGALAAAGVLGVAWFGRRSAGPSTTASKTTGSGIKLSDIKVGESAPFDSSQGPAVVIRTGENDVVAFTSTCTHEGCIVGYQADRALLVCPCHGATFDPRRNGEATAPASRPLDRIKVRVTEAGRVVEA